MDDSIETPYIDGPADEELETGNAVEDDVEEAEVDSHAADEDRSHATLGQDEDDDEEEGSKAMTHADDASQVSVPGSASGTVAEGATASANSKKRTQPQIPASARKGRSPAVKGLTIPFRTVKKVGYVQQERKSCRYPLYFLGNQSFPCSASSNLRSISLQCTFYFLSLSLSSQAMKLDPDIPIVQNEAAIMTTMAAELFLKSLAKESLKISKARGRNTIR
jgi:hypothetical protein